MSIDLTKFRGERTVAFGSDVTPLSTGSFLFDYITGIGGLPRGRMVEAYGLESSGKSTAFYQAGVQAQRAGGALLLLDYEHAWADRYAKQLGLDLDPSKLLVEQPHTLQEGFDKAAEVTAAYAATPGAPPLVVMFDSVAAIPMEDEKATGDNTAAMRRAKDIRGYLRLCMGDVARAGAVWAFVNHEMTNIFMGNPYEILAQKAKLGDTGTPGGKAIKYYSSMRFAFQAGQKIKGEVVDPVTGEVKDGFIATKVKVTAIKNKVAAPHRTAEVFIRYGYGIDNSYSLVDVGLRRGLLQRDSKSSPILFPDGFSARGANDAIAYVQENHAMANQLDSDLRNLIEAEWQKEQERILSQALQYSADDEEDGE